MNDCCSELQRDRSIHDKNWDLIAVLHLESSKKDQILDLQILLCYNAIVLFEVDYKETNDGMKDWEKKREGDLLA